jgi:adenosylcobinamide-GDP ribazoletransferase
MLSVVPVPAVTSPSAKTRRDAILLAPAVGLALGLITGGIVLLLTTVTDSTAILAVSALVTSAALTGALHLDGLADVADALGSRRSPTDAREVMRRSDVGPFGVVTLVLTLLIQFAALSTLFAHTGASWTLFALGSASLLSRTAITISCRRGVQAADESGLGASVAETVPRVAAAAVVAAALTLTVAAAALGDEISTVRALLSALASIAVAEAWRRHCIRRLGGVTGDVLGSVEQVTWTTYLLLLALAG